MLSFFPRGVLGEILKLIESVSEGFPSYSFTFGEKMGSNVMTLKPFLNQENYIVVVYDCILLLYFFFLKGF